METEAYYGVPFKVGRSDPAARLLLERVSELREDPILIDMYVCPNVDGYNSSSTRRLWKRLRRSLTRKQ